MLELLFDHELEKKVVGFLVLNPDRYFEVAQNMNENAMENRRCRAIYRAIGKLFHSGHSVDESTIKDVLEKNIEAKEDWQATLLDFSVAGMTVFDPAYYIEQINDLAQRRALFTYASEIVNSVRDKTKKVDDIVNDGANKILHVSAERRKDGISFVDSMLQHNATLRDELRGVPCIFRGFTETFGLDKPATLTIVAGRPGMGKSGSMFCKALQQAYMGYKVGYFSLEMSDEELAERRLSGATKVPFTQIVDWKQNGGVPDAVIEKFNTAASLIADKVQDNLYIFDDPSQTTSDIYTRSMMQKFDIIYIDHIGLCGDLPGETAYNRMSHISWQCKIIAKKLDIPVIALAQLSRALEARQDKHPIMSDLRDSGRIEENADRIIFLYRDDFYQKLYQNLSEIEFGVSKNRGGKLGDFIMTYDMAAQWLAEV